MAAGKGGGQGRKRSTFNENLRSKLLSLDNEGQGINGSTSLLASVTEVSSQPSIKLHLSTNTPANTKIFTTQVEDSKLSSIMVMSPGNSSIQTSAVCDRLLDSTQVSLQTEYFHLPQPSSRITISSIRATGGVVSHRGQTLFTGAPVHSTVPTNESSSKLSSIKTSKALVTFSRISSFPAFLTKESELIPATSTTVYIATTPNPQSATSSYKYNISNTITSAKRSKRADNVAQVTSMSSPQGSSTIPIPQNNTNSIRVIMSSAGIIAPRSRTSCNNSSVCLLNLSAKNKATTVSSAPIATLNSQSTKATHVTSGEEVTVFPSDTTLLTTSATSKGISVNIMTSLDEITKTTGISQNLQATEVISHFVRSGTGSASYLVRITSVRSKSVRKVTTRQSSTTFLNVEASTLPCSNADQKASSLSPSRVKISTALNSKHFKQTTTTHRHHKTTITARPLMSSSVETSGERLKTPNTGNHSTQHVRTSVTSSIISIKRTIKSTSHDSHQLGTTSLQKATSTLTSKMLTTTSIVHHSLPRFRTFTPLSSAFFILKSSRELSESKTEKIPKTVSIALSDSTQFIISKSGRFSKASVLSTHQQSSLPSISSNRSLTGHSKISKTVSIAPSESTIPLPSKIATIASSSLSDEIFISNNKLSLGSKTIQIKKSKMSTLNLTSVGETLALKSSSAQLIISKPGIFSKASVLTTHQQSSFPSTSSTTSLTGHFNIFISTTSMITSSRPLPPKSIHSTQTLTRNFPSFTQAITSKRETSPTATPPGTSHVPRTSEKYSSKQSSQTISTVQPKTASSNRNLSLPVTSVRPSLSSTPGSATNRSPSIGKPSTRYSSLTSTSLFPPKNTTPQTVVITSQVTADSKIPSSSHLTLTSISNVSPTKTVSLSVTYSSKGVRSASLMHKSLVTSKKTRPASISAVTLKLESSEVNSKLFRFSATSLHSIESTESLESVISVMTLAGHSSLTFSPKITVVTLENTQTQASTEPQTALKVTRQSSQIFVDATTVGTATPVLVTSSSASTQTEPPLEIPSQFEGRMILGMPWKPQYEYPPGSQTLATTITEKLTKALNDLEGFISVQVLRLWKSSVGVDFVVYVNKQASVDESVVERKLIEANSTGVLDLPLTSLQFKVKDTPTTQNLPTTSSTTEEKSIELWVIILIVAIILVFLLLIIICIIVAKLGKQRGGLRKSGKYKLSSFDNFLNSEQTESRTKPVILKMQERKRTVRGSRKSVGLYDVYSLTNSHSEESLAQSQSPTIRPSDDYSVPAYRNSNNDSTTVSSKTQERAKDVRDDPSQISILLNDSMTPSIELDNKSNQGYRNSHEDLTANEAVRLQLSETKQISEGPEASQPFVKGVTSTS
ncbi:mucin-5AC-like [Stylophora pistillata]|uniref:mucin-5AC-like n=1 Tax=Stylophora pistillata TaxID=50429 RepID=UPI000C053F0D|nr:mucin-5AC-like [Stylophora pistillata]